MLTIVSCLFLLGATCIGSREHDIYRFSGQVIDSQNQVLFLLRTNGCIRIRANPPNDKAFRQGSLLQITAVLNATGNMTLVNAETLGWKPLPEPLEVSGKDAAGGKLLNRYVRVRGVVASSVPDDLDSRYNWTILRTPTGPVTFATLRRDYPPARLRELIDAEATIDGLVLRFSGWRERLSGRIHPIGERPFVLTKPAPASIDLIPPLGESQSPHRQRVSGIVLSPCSGHFFIRTQDGSCIRVLPTERQPGLVSGQRVTVAGFADRDAMHETQLSEALVRIDDPAPLAAEPAEPITMDDLFLHESGGVLVNNLFHEKIVQLEGRLVEGCSAPNCLLMTDGGRSVTVDLSAFAEADRQGLLPGTRISVTGLCIGEFRPHCSQIYFPHFGGFTVIPRSIDDITILSLPPWWTPQRFLAVIGILLVGIIAILVWNRALRIASERRGKALAWEQTCHAKSELKVEERTRLAVELHDSISQTLTGVALQIETALGLPGVSFGPAEKMLLTARQMLASCRQELRCCLWDLRSRTFEEQDLTEAIRRTIEPHAAEAKVAVRFNVARELLSEATVHTILKIVRELVVNAIRHGKASNIRIAGEYREGNVRFSVWDNGIGFDPDGSPGARQGHFGLQGIRERAVERQGNVKIDAAPGQGAKITVMLKETIV